VFLAYWGSERIRFNKRMGDATTPEGFALKLLSYRLCRRMCGGALPRWALNERKWG
jgi:hypothetical protein